MITVTGIGLKKEISNVKYHADMWDETIEKELDVIENRFKVLTYSWEKKPKFDRRKPHTEVDDRVGHVGAIRRTQNNIIFSAINYGTKSRTIISVGRPMWFRAGYIPGTTAGSYQSKKYKRFGEWVMAFWDGRARISIIKNHKISPRLFTGPITYNREIVFSWSVKQDMERIAFLLFK